MNRQRIRRTNACRQKIELHLGQLSILLEEPVLYSCLAQDVKSMLDLVHALIRDRLRPVLLVFGDDPLCHILQIVSKLKVAHRLIG